MEVSEGLQQLNASTVAVHITEAADIHEDVKAEGGSGGEATEELVMAAAMLGTEANELRAARFGKGGDPVAELAIGVMAVRIEQRGSQLNVERLAVLDQVDDGSGG